MAERKTRATLEGVVISNKSDKTITVLVETHKRHKKYGKRVKYRKRYYAHDENNEANVGDFVRIAATRPLSKTKRWRLVKVLTLAEVSIEEYQEAIAQEEVLEEISEARHHDEEQVEVAEANEEAAEVTDANAEDKEENVTEVDHD
jgi:small subunit ribosomal protein S17